MNNQTQQPVAVLDFATDVLHGLNVREGNYLATVSAAPVSYRVVVSTQVRENYGAHDWDGIGECPQYWKCKGGHDYIVAEGQSEFDILTKDEMDYVPAGISSNSDYFMESIVGVAFVPADELTYEEQMCKEMLADGHMHPQDAERMLAGARRFLPK